jgi:F-type H+-transporting ATPase subunit b
MELIIAAGLLEPYMGLVFWKAVAFLILLLLLWKFAWGPITSALEQREVTIDSSIKRAEKALAEARQIQADNEKARRESEVEAQRIIREAREAAEKMRNEEIERTRLRIEQLEAQARAEIAREKQGAIDALRREVADLAILAAEKVIGNNLDQERERRLVNDFISELPSN